jgi:M3 family oligoendopeptidase
MKLSDIHAETPSRETLARAYEHINQLLDEGDLGPGIEAWDRLRREYETWTSLTHLHFEQDTANEDFKNAKAYADELGPVATAHEIALKRRLLALGNRAAVEAIAGGHALRLWETDVTTFDPAIAADLEQEAKLYSRYTELRSSARIEVAGEIINLSALPPFLQSLDRDVRHRADAAGWGFFADHAEEFDEIFDQLVQLRHGMAKKLGYDNFIELGYRRMRRIDYGAADVARYREQVLTHVTPLVAGIMETRRAANGWDGLRHWDESLTDPAGNPKPQGDEATLVAQAQKMFEAMTPDMAAFFRDMNEGGFLDLTNRPTKAGGGFCTSFPTVGMPFIFANFNGTHHDIDVFTHEMGHAFQNFRSRELGFDYLWPTSESAEIHSMSLEHLAYPHISYLVGEAAAARYVRLHLIETLQFLPYGVCGDHFQHEVYANPDASPAERHAMWRRLERLYMPWRDYGDIAFGAKGGVWQRQLHFYGLPFYYIDYTLASCCALQFWVKSRENYEAAMADYVALCGRGGAAPFQELVASAGLISPFEKGALETVVRDAQAVLA